MYRSGEGKNEFAFIMIFDGNSGDVHFERFSIDNFVSKTAAYDTGIGKNHFSKDKIILDIRSESFSIRGSVNFSSTTPWPRCCAAKINRTSYTKTFRSYI